MKKIIVFLLTFTLLILPCNALVATEYNYSGLTEPLSPVSAKPEKIGADLKINAKSAVLMEANTGTVLYEQNPHEKTAPASITKIMSLLLVMEALSSGKINLETKISASEHACSMGGSQIWLEPNEKMTVDELLKASAVASANDAIVALGEAVSGSEETFVEKMNEKAKSMGLSDTNFENATGLDSDNHYTSAFDVAKMSAELISHKLIKNYTTVWMDTLRDGKCELVNTNKLVKFYSGCTGLKTGTTSKAGSCLSATAERDGLSLIAVVMGADSSKDRFNGARKLLDYGFANYKTATVEVTEDLLKPIKIEKGFWAAVTPTPECKKSVLLEKGEEENITTKIISEKKLTAPIKKGQTLGKAEIYLGDEKIAEIKLLSPETVKKLTVISSFVRMLGFVVKS